MRIETPERLLAIIARLRAEQTCKWQRSDGDALTMIAERHGQTVTFTLSEQQGPPLIPGRTRIISEEDKAAMYIVLTVESLQREEVYEARRAASGSELIAYYEAVSASLPQQ